jgi:putative oxygen-independent coproporphyrinogen III oxidase
VSPPTLPTAVYIHVPWCVRKCPYCDFNSHERGDGLPEAAYLHRILADLTWDLECFGPPAAPITSLFFGGGTPSLLHPETIGAVIEGIAARLPLAADCEITLEANPGTAEAGRFQGYRAAGVNRLSLGVQSFSSRALTALGRIHDGEDALRALALAKAAGFPRINLDLMHGLPGQTVAEGQRDIELALDAGVSHLSYYQLTIEPNTAFYRRPPTLPEESILERLEDRGRRLLEEAGFEPYEISAWARDGHYCRHNLTYWRFGDYYGLGPGAHGKLSRRDRAGGLQVMRTQRSRVPEHWLRGDGAPSAQTAVAGESLREECLLNVLRLREGISFEAFEAHTGLPRACLEPQRETQVAAGLLQADRLAPTDQGLRFLNPLLAALSR